MELIGHDADGYVWFRSRTEGPGWAGRISQSRPKGVALTSVSACRISAFRFFLFGKGADGHEYWKSRGTSERYRTPWARLSVPRARNMSKSRPYGSSTGTTTSICATRGELVRKGVRRGQVQSRLVDAFPAAGLFARQLRLDRLGNECARPLWGWQERPDLPETDALDRSPPEWMVGPPPAFSHRRFRPDHRLCQLNRCGILTFERPTLRRTLPSVGACHSSVPPTAALPVLQAVPRESAATPVRATWRCG